MKKHTFKFKHFLFICFIFSPFLSKSQEVLPLKEKTNNKSKDSIIIARYLRTIENNRLVFRNASVGKESIVLNFKVPKVKVYNAASYYADGKFACFPFNSWGPYQVPFHLNQPIVVPAREK